MAEMTTRRALSEALAGSKQPLLLIDCEGAEQELLDPTAVPELKSTTIVVEVHDHLRPGIGQILRDRFAPTHEIESIESRPRDGSEGADAAALRRLRREHVAQLVHERDVRQEWLRMRPKR
jgi:hypothetical protein